MNEIPYIAYEGTIARMERINKRLIVVLVLLIILLVGSNLAWIWYESQYEDVVTTISQEAENDRGSIFLNGTGEVTINGESETDSNN